MRLQVKATALPDVLEVSPKCFDDARGFFMESYNQREFADAGIGEVFVQDNHSGSRRGVLRGLHYQLNRPQGKLVRVTRGEVYDVAVDIRPGSPHFGRWAGLKLTAENRKQLWVPAGFAHGFLVLSDSAEFMYKCTDFYFPEHERCLRWDDPDIGIDWPLDGIGDPVLSDKDRAGHSLASLETGS